MPISITVAATAAIPLLVLVLLRFVPILPIAEMEELGAEEALETAGPRVAERRPAPAHGSEP
ncbi:MAG: hypothetical protein ACYDH5_01130 [Acidimicrobiales bacterium]